jgi:hypothetical protein
MFKGAGRWLCSLRAWTILLLLTGLAALAVGCQPAPPRRPLGTSRPATHPAKTPVSTRPATTAQAATGDDLRQTLAYLASDGLEGRGTGSDGLERAATYIATRFRRGGLQPVPGLDGYSQRFQFTLQAKPSASCVLSVGEAALGLDVDYRPLAFSGEGDYAGPVHFAGYGISSAQHGYDDYAGIDVAGRIVLVLRFEPHTPEGKSRLGDDRFTDHALLAEKARVAAEHGARALLLVTPPQFHGTDLLMPTARQYASPDATIPVVQITQKAANLLLAKAGSPQLADLQARIDQTGQPSSIELPGVTVQGTVRMNRTTQSLRNIVGILPGHGGATADELVVVGAHYDHLGRAEGDVAPGDDDRIFNGADDNASGTTALLALVDRLGAGRPLNRSILFVAFTAEEVGLIGSNRFVSEPPLPLSHMVAMLNLDMVGRLRGQTLLVGGAGTAAPFDAILEKVDADSPLQFRSIGRGGAAPSDHMSFAAKRIPVLFLHTGLHADYHRPSDEADTINYDGLGEVVDVAEQLLKALASMPSKPAYVEAGLGPDAEAIRSASPPQVRVTLGIIPDYASLEAAEGVRIVQVVPGTAAADAGLASEDVIVGIDGEPVDSLHDLMLVMERHAPGDKVAVRVVRDGQELELPVTLAEKNIDQP